LFLLTDVLIKEPVVCEIGRLASGDLQDIIIKIVIVK